MLLGHLEIMPLLVLCALCLAQKIKENQKNWIRNLQSLFFEKFLALRALPLAALRAKVNSAPVVGIYDQTTTSADAETLRAVCLHFGNRAGCDDKHAARYGPARRQHRVRCAGDGEHDGDED